MNTELLTEIGLTKSEINVYFALLELESSTVGPIYEKAKVPDSKIYSILDKLKEKGLVSFVIKNNVKHFQAADPKNILQILNDREQKIAEQKMELEKNIIPQIEMKRKLTEEKNEATVYESYQGMKSAFNIILESLEKGNEYCVFMLGDSLEKKEVINFFQNFHKKRIEKGIHVRLISEEPYKEIIKKYHTYKDMKIRYTKQKLPIGTFIFNNHMMTATWGETPAAFIIKSKKNYEYHKQFFEYIWKKSN